MKLNKAIILVAVLLFVTSLPFIASADFELARWGFAREIIIPAELPKTDFALVEFDNGVYQHSQFTMQDLRVIDDQQKEIAAMLIAQQDEKAPSIPVPIINHETTRNASLYTLDCGTPPSYHGIDITTTTENFSRRVKIEGTTDGVWRLVRADGYILDFSRDEQRRVTQIRFDQVMHRYLRLTIYEPRGSAIEKPEVALLPAKNIPAPYRETTAEILSQTEDKTRRTSVLTIKLPVTKAPSSRVELLTDSTNFSRRVEIDSTNDAPEKAEARWFRAGSGEVHDLAFDEVKLHSLAIDYPHTRAGYLRVKIFNQDDQPLKIRGIKIFAQPWYLLFKPEAGRSYRLFYGNEKAVAPEYDLAQLVTYVKPDNLPKLKLGAETKFAVAPEPVNTQRNSWLVIIAIFVAVAVLGSLIYRLARSSTN